MGADGVRLWELVQKSTKNVNLIEFVYWPSNISHHCSAKHGSCYWSFTHTLNAVGAQ